MDYKTKKKCQEELQKALKLIAAINETHSMILDLEDRGITRMDLAPFKIDEGSPRPYILSEMLINHKEFSKVVKYALIGFLKDHKKGLHAALEEVVTIKGVHLDLKA